MSRLEEILAEQMRRSLRGPECPAPERWLAFAAGELDPAASERLRAHRDGCAACAAEYEVARAFLEESEAPAERVAVDRIVERLRESSPVATPSSVGAPRWRAVEAWLRRSAFGLAAAALAIAVAVAIWPRPPELPAPVAGSVRGATVVLGEPVGDFEVLPQRFTWQPVDGAARYHVAVLAVDDTVLLEATTEEPSWQVPERASGILRRRVTYRWRVEAVDAAGRLVAASPLAEFRLTPTRQRPAEAPRGPAGAEPDAGVGREPGRAP